MLLILIIAIFLFIYYQISRHGSIKRVNIMPAGIKVIILEHKWKDHMVQFYYVQAENQQMCQQSSLLNETKIHCSEDYDAEPYFKLTQDGLGRLYGMELFLPQSITPEYR